MDKRSSKPKPRPRTPKLTLREGSGQTTTRPDRAVATAVSKWFATAARPLPWRTTPRNPYHAIVSEFMLQQTQVSRVLEKFEPFLTRFPTLESLAAAPESDILALWSGLGYYRRARLLHAAAKAIAANHAGKVPSDPAALLALPGIGRYTAGSIASIVFHQPQPIVDGNVARVLLRIAGREQSAAEAANWLWTRAAELVTAAESPALFNEGLMELGATICTPKSPRCDECPVAAHCRARAESTTDGIPTPKARAIIRDIDLHMLLAIDPKGRVLLEQRPPTGLWASLWQLPEIDSTKTPPTREPLTTFTHQTTHRRVTFTVFLAPRSTHAVLARRPTARWTTRADWPTLGLSNPIRKILALANVRIAAKDVPKDVP